MKPEYTLVCGVDEKHLRQLRFVWPTWKLHKPSLLDMRMVVFFDHTQISRSDVRQAIDHPRLSIIDWPMGGVNYDGDPDSKFHHPQRYKMLSGFVHVPAMTVTTDYWMKLDTDVVARSYDDWIDPIWFEGHPSIIAPKWTFTKPPQQMQLLDDWVNSNKERLSILAHKPPLNLVPKVGSDRLCHERIISWCGFFSTALSRVASEWAQATCGQGLLPVPSQDGYLWYVAKRLETQIKTVNMKRRGWEWWSTMANVEKHSQDALKVN